MSGILVSSTGNSLRLSPAHVLSHPKTVKSRNRNARFPSRATSFRAYTQTLNAEPAVTESTVRRRVSSLYELLKVNETASLTEIKTAYRSLAKVSNKLQTFNIIFTNHHEEMMIEDQPTIVVYYYRRRLYTNYTFVRSGTRRTKSTK